MLALSRIRAGHWEGLWQGPRPDLHVLLDGAEIPGLNVQPSGADVWRLTLPIPVEMISEGVRTFVLRVGQDTVGRFVISAGGVLDDDLVAEVALLRAELDLLKQAFRTHCATTTVPRVAG